MNRQPRFDHAIERIDKLLERRNREGIGPGLSLALTTGRELLATRTYGVANADSREPVTDKTLFQIGSITKHFTAVGCMRLHESGCLNLHAPVTDYLDWFEVGSQFETPVTIHHLLTHTAGLVMMIDSYPSSWWQTWALRDTQLGFEPGAKFSYSNVGYNVLQCVIQTITGQGFGEALGELIFEPLGMANTYGEIRNGLYERMAKGHKYSAHDDRPVAKPEKQTMVNWCEMSAGCASVVTTAADLAIFLRMLLNRGRANDGSAFLSEETFELMTHPHAVMDGFFDGTSQGYGVLIEQSQATDHRPRILGGGENLGFEAAMYGDFEAGVGVVLFCNSFDVPWTETRWILDALIAAARGEALPEFPEPKVAPLQETKKKLAAYAGDYMSAERAFTLSEEAGHLTLTADGTRSQLEPLWGDCFFTTHPGFDGAMLTFGRDEAGEVVEAFQLGEWFRNDRYAGPAEHAYAAEWDTYVGHYRAFGNLVTNFRIFVRKGTLYCQSFGGYVDQSLTDLGNGWFRNGDGTSPERMTFDCLANGKALRCRASGANYYRVDT